MAVDVFARTLALASLGNGGGGSAVDTYTKAEINKMFSEAGTVQVEAVDALPTEDIKENVIYLVPNGSSGNNFYDECMYINGKWETIGTTEIDMSQYSTTEELQEMMLQELAKYITNADFTEALKDYATKKYVDDSVAAIEIPSLDGLATEEYADAAGQKAFDDMAAIAGDVNSLTTETHETFAAAINEINAKVDGIGNQIVISSIEPLDATKDPNLINNYITQEELKEFHTRILNGGSGKIIFQGSVEDITYVSHYVPQYPSPSMFFYCVNNYIGTPSTKDGATVYKEKYAPAFVLIYTEQTNTYSWGRTSQTSIEVPSVEGLATEEYVNNQIAVVSGNGINCYDINTRLYQYTDGGGSSTQITDAEDIAVLETIINTQVPNTEIFLINNTDAHNESTYLATMTYKERNYCEINISSTLLWLGSVTGNLQIDYEEIDGQLKITNAIAGVYEFGYEIAINYYNKDEVADQLEAKQDTLTAGEGISIVNNVISATSSGESSVAVFEGTQEEYDALSDEEKAKYTIAVIDDGEEV